MTNEDVLRKVLRAWSEGIVAGQEAMRLHMTDDCPWEQAGLPTTTGGDEAAKLFGAMESMGFSSMAVEFRNVAVAEDVVFSERVDWWCVPMVLDLDRGRLSFPLRATASDRPRLQLAYSAPAISSIVEMVRAAISLMFLPAPSAMSSW